MTGFSGHCQGLLGLTQLDIHEMAHSSSDAAQLLQELNALHSREVAASLWPEHRQQACKLIIHSMRVCANMLKSLRKYARLHASPHEMTCAMSCRGLASTCW